MTTALIQMKIKVRVRILMQNTVGGTLMLNLRKFSSSIPNLGNGIMHAKCVSISSGVMELDIFNVIVIQSTELNILFRVNTSN